MTPSVPSSESGTAAPAAATAEVRLRNIATTRITRAIEISKVCCTSCTLARIVSDRSRMVLTVMPPGSHRSSCGSSRCTPSTTWMTLASDCLKMIMTTAGLPSTVPPCRRSRTSSATLPTEASRTMAPFCCLTMMPAYSSGVLSRSFTAMADAWSRPSISPVAWVTLFWLIAWRIASSPMPAALAAAGSMVTRMAGCSAPAMMTWETPGTWAMRGDTTLSAAS